jgi:hypothetical protein
VKIHVTAVEVIREKERQGETQFNTKTYSFVSFIPPLYANVLFLQVFFNLTLCMTALRVMVLCFSYFTDNSINSDWVHLLLSHNGYPVDGALGGAGSLSPICCGTLSGSAGAGT